MAFVPENELEDVLQRAVADPLARADFYRLLVASPLVVLGRELPGGHDGKGQMSIPSVRHNGREYLPIFSAMSRLKRFAPANMEHFTMDARPLFEATRGANFVLNPNSECGKALMAAEIAFWLDPAAQARPDAGNAAIRVAIPPAHPAELVEALTSLFRNRATVIAAYVAEATPLDGSEPPHPLIGIEQNGDWRQISQEIRELATAILPQTIIDVIRIDRTLPAAPLPEHLQEIAPFYTRATPPH
ncbi:MAG TPA: enhanced serine sensitivity protein SseB C-terminal domain-containing protein [Rhizomicrobium sp.]